MREERRGLLASYAYLDSALEALRALREEGVEEFTVFSPFPEHHLEEAVGRGESPVRVFALVGGLTGAATGFALATWTGVDWPLVTGGKPIVSIPAYVVIAFELTVLFGAFATVIGLFLNARLPRVRGRVVYDPEFGAGRFGIHVVTGPERLERVRAILRAREPESLVEVAEGVGSPGGGRG